MKKLQTLWETSSKFQKQSKLKAAYMEREEFKDSDPHKGFFCYNCIYRMDSMGEKCMIVDDKGPDILGNISDVIAPHGWRNGYKPNYKKSKKGS
ncbi:MAG: hypothetical protein ACTHME_01720 [Candidatus Nitrosocosmicus sp.]